MSTDYGTQKRRELESPFNEKEENVSQEKEFVYEETDENLEKSPISA